jgi:hypothetical protein
MHLPERHTAHNWEELSSKHRLLQNIRKELNKLQNEFVSVEEFFQYTSLKMEQVELLIIV